MKRYPTKAENRARAENWREAVRDGRVLNVMDGTQKIAYPTHEAMRAAIEIFELSGVDVSIVVAPIEQEHTS